jgi:hypothetical protein|tara:strand:+ start:2587 stop:2829 length:243 start_codon:yes stop_codon:yes gene_type:complete
MDVIELPGPTLDEVISCFRVAVADKKTAPGEAGKRAFLEAALSNPRFLGEELMVAIDERRGDISVADYLYAHQRFGDAYG